MEKMTLTAEEINAFDTYNADTMAANNSLNIALNYHSNSIAQLEAKKTTAWQKLAERLGLDLKEKAYSIDSTGPEVIVVEKKD